MFQNHKKTLIITSLLILLPILFGLLLWNQLPDQLPTHWGPDGQPDSWSSRSFAVFGLPVSIFILQWVCMFVTSADKRNANQTGKIITITLWICPVISIFGSIAIYGYALGHEFSMSTLPCGLLGVMFLIIGNYLPKCKHNYTIGIKLPWTIASEENWNATHRFSGKLWVAGGALYLLLMFLPGIPAYPVLLAVLAAMAVIPTVYSWRYAKKHG